MRRGETVAALLWIAYMVMLIVAVVRVE